MKDLEVPSRSLGENQPKNGKVGSSAEIRMLVQRGQNMSRNTSNHWNQ